MAVTLATLKTRCRQRSDMENSTFISDNELTTLVNGSIAELHDLLVQSFGTDYYLESYEFSTSGGTDAYTLPSDFYKMRGLDIKLNSTYWETVQPFSFNERNYYQDTTWSNALSGRYRLRGSDLVLVPKPTTSFDCVLWYTPVATELSASGDTFNGINGYEEYVVIDTAIKMLDKEESDTKSLILAKKDMKRRIEEASQNRDSGFSEKISDVNKNYDFTDLMYYGVK